jgi:hypothetical protein
MPTSKGSKRNQAAREALRQKRLDDEMLEILPTSHSDSETEPKPKKFKSGRPKVLYSEQKFKRTIRRQAWDSLLALAGSPADTEVLIVDVLKRYLPELHEKLVSFDILAQNLTEVFERFSTNIRGSSFGSCLAATATQNLPIKTAMDITQYSKSSISIGRSKLKVLQTPTCENQVVEQTEPTALTEEPPVYQIPQECLFPNPSNKSLRLLPFLPIVPPISNLKPTQKQLNQKNSKSKKKVKQPKLYTTNGNPYVIPPKGLPKIPQVEWFFFIDWILTVALIGDSKDPELVLIWVTWTAAYAAYKVVAVQNGFPVHSEKWFVKYVN